MNRITYIPIILLVISCGENKTTQKAKTPEKQVVKLEAKKEQEPTAEKQADNKPDPLLEKEKTVQFIPPIAEEDDVPPPMIDYVKGDENVGMMDSEYYDSEPALPPLPPRPQEPEIYDFVDEPAEFPGGMTALREYLATNYVVPESVKGTGYKGKVFVKFVVSTEGNISNVKVVRGAPNCPDCDKEAIRAVKSMPKWTPGKINGKPVNSFYNMPVRIEYTGN